MHKFGAVVTAVFLGLLTACGPSDQGAGAPEEGVTAETTVLAGDDLAGLEEDNVVFNLQWVSGPVNREPTPGGAPSQLELLTTVPAEGFDRVVFAFSEGAFPGYEIGWAEDGARDCAGESVDIAGDRHLRVRLRMLTAPAGVGEALQVTHPNLQAVALTCRDGAELEWHLGFRDSAQVRVVEMRAPSRLVVDVQHGQPRSN